MNIYKDITELIGNTPLVRINKLVPKKNSNIFAKLEYFNPLSSIKDRIALSMIEKAEKEGLLKQNSTIIEPTSGNTGIGLSYIAAVKGYKIILIMPDSMSEERKKLLKILGAKIILTPGNEGMNGAINKATELAIEYGDKGFMPQQFKNPENPGIHRRTTAEEIWRDTDGKVDIFIACVGTGGTLTGTGERLKELNNKIKIIAVEPDNSAVLSGEKPGPHKIQGIGAGFIPDVLDISLYDEIIKVTDDEAFLMTKYLAKNEGLFVGISSGAAMTAALKISAKKENENKNIIVLFPDTGERYLSMSFWND